MQLVVICNLFGARGARDGGTSHVKASCELLLGVARRFGAGPNQSVENPLGEGGDALHEWFVPTRTFQQVHGREGGTTGVDDEFAARVLANIGAWIMGRGPWPRA